MVADRHQGGFVSNQMIEKPLSDPSLFRRDQTDFHIPPRQSGHEERNVKMKPLFKHASFRGYPWKSVSNA